MSCNHRMKQIGRAALANGITPTASYVAYTIGRYPRTADVYMEMLQALDIRDVSELYEYARHGKKPSKKSRTTGTYILAGASTLAVMMRLRHRKHIRQIEKMRRLEQSRLI